MISYEGATALKIGAGNTAIPNFKLKNWVNRPAALDSDGEAVYEEQAPAPAPVRQAARPAPKPVPVVEDDEEMFN